MTDENERNGRPMAWKGSEPIDPVDGAIDEALASSVPASTADFWARMDASLEAVVTEDAADVRRLEQSVGATRSASDTNSELIRLTDMTMSTNHRSSLLLRIAAAIAFVAVIGGVAALALSNRGGTRTVDVAGDAATTTPSTVGEVSTSTTMVGSSMPTSTIGSSTPTDCVAGCAEGLPISVLTQGVVIDSLREAIGCWFRVTGSDLDGDGYDDPAFFSNDLGAVMVIDGEPAIFEPNPDAESIGPWTAADYSGEVYHLSFTDVGDERPTSIESTERPATLHVDVDGGGSVEAIGVLACGV